MSTDQVNLFLAQLALFAEIATVGLVATAVMRAVRPSTPWPLDVLNAVRPVALVVGAAVAIVAALGSLYYSEVADFPPCRLWWFQRIGVYPWPRCWASPPGAATAACGGTRGRWPWGAGLVAAWHIVVQRNPSLESGACDPANPSRSSGSAVPLCE